APVMVVVLLSFNSARHGMAWEGFSLEWHRALFQNPAILEAFGNSLILAVVSTLIALPLGIGIVLGFGRNRWRGLEWLRTLIQLPALLPDIVMAAALLIFAQTARSTLGVLDLGMTAMVLGHVSFQIPFVAVVVGARYLRLDPALEEAARDLGAPPIQVLRTVTLPLLSSSILAAGLVCVALSLDDFIVSFFASGPGSTTLPILIHASVRRGLTPEIHALSTWLVFAAALLAIAASRRSLFDRPIGPHNNGLT
ncbi:MAG: ABC transporter permease, partial [Verrucomicrobia bacterium]|nr:ABC transporter permease [Verrucomicrobiota bacterium]